MGRHHLKKSKRQAIIDEDLTGAKDNYEDTRSLGWYGDLASLSDEEHTPEFPSPQGPNPIELIDRIERDNLRRADEFDRTYERWGIFPGRRLKF